MPSCVSRASIEVIGSFYPLLVRQQEWHAAADQMILTIGHMLGCFASDRCSSVARPASSPAVVTSAGAVSGEKRQDLRLGWLRRLRASGLTGARCVGSGWEAQGNVRAGVLALPPGHPYLCLPLQFATAPDMRLLAFVDADELERPRQAAEAELQEPDRWGTMFTLLQSWGKRTPRGRRSHPVRARRRMPVRRHAAGASH